MRMRYLWGQGRDWRDGVGGIDGASCPFVVVVASVPFVGGVCVDADVVLRACMGELFVGPALT